ncbi:L-lactate dehydrogenase [Enterococcus sp. 669A]|uniref:L-lactate dehydrogenase n=1 Tax=Candidatus Enterococcus moelleringii TaxID=2815325 RepID=A0ABS3LFD9_9ENTE|nr:L-lactate dehydrogenase [Enterococcus sp. 669A]MBO1308364.1 L-lactate dehydrogenase [Enterococcus sp. 669A]
MKKAAIIGVGHVGSTLAYTLISRNIIDELVLFDKKEGQLLSEYNDLFDGQVDRYNYVKLIEPNLEELADTDVLIFSAGDITIFEGNSDRFAELYLTKEIVEEWAPKIKASGFKGILINITNPCDVVTQRLQELTGIPRERIFGTGTTLDSARMKHAVSEQFNVHPSSVEGYVMGEHGESQFVAWSSVRIGGVPISEMLSPEELEKLETTARAGGWITMRGKGYTSYGIANQAALVIEAVLNNNHKVLPVSSYSEKDQCYVGHPAQVAADGIIKDYHFKMSELEYEKWEKTIETIKFMHSTAL